uniref:Uncharacterized protein n=1 Tax=Megaselia scalaris TaxID=36166 RepID=T1GYS0_MEGSC
MTTLNSLGFEFSFKSVNHNCNLLVASHILTAEITKCNLKSKDIEIVKGERMPFGRKSPLDALAHPGAVLAYKYTQFRQKRREAASRRITEKELTSLHHKIRELNYQ